MHKPKDEYAPRWIRDKDENVLYERQPDNSYAPAFRLVPLESQPK